MKVFISRVSTEDQSELRQIQNIEHFDKVIIDKCDGDIPLWERHQVLNMDLKNKSVEQIEMELSKLFKNVKRT